MANFKFELLKSQDVDKCIEAILSVPVIDLPGATLETRKMALKNILHGPYVLTLTAQKGNEIVGVINCTRSSEGGVPPRIGFLSIMDEESAKEGLGPQLIDELLKVAHKEMPEASYINVSAQADSAWQVSLYVSKGFRVCGFARDVLLQDRDVVFMKKAIHPQGEKK
jgi:hypothetical protein